MRVRIPRTSSGRLLALPVHTAFRQHPNVEGTTGDAVRLADGTYRVVLSDLQLPPGAVAPSNVRARPSDGAVRITWDPPAHGAGGATYLVTSLLDGDTTIASGSQATLPARNGTPQAWTVQRITDVGAGAPAATPTVVPRRLTLGLRGPREGQVVSRGRVEYAVRASVPIESINCAPDPGLVLIRCEQDSVVVRSDPGAGIHSVQVWVYDFGGSEVKMTRTFVTR